MAVIPLPPGSGMPPIGETRFSPNEVAMQFGAGTTPQQVAAIVQRFGLTVEAQRTIGVLGRAIYTLRIGNGQSVRQAIGAVEGARVNAAVQPVYTFALTQDQTSSIKTLAINKPAIRTILMPTQAIRPNTSSTSSSLPMRTASPTATKSSLR